MFKRLIFTFVFMVSTIQSAEVIGNLSGFYLGYAPVRATQYIAVGFQTGSQSQSLQSVTIILQADSGTESSATTYVELRSDDGSNKPSTTVITTLNPNPLTGTNYGFTTHPEVTFTPTSTITLNANTKYWIVVRGGSDIDSLGWNKNNPNQDPSNGTGTFISYQYSDSGIDWYEYTAGFSPAISIKDNSTPPSSTAVPITPLGLLMLLSGIIGSAFVGLRRKKA
ncbi:MAG: hypothetical protein JXQ76_05110 [Campylobacterales bacterium]|nr:hypothetical protein [Campylobacterales bacterium]